MPEPVQFAWSLSVHHPVNGESRPSANAGPDATALPGTSRDAELVASVALDDIAPIDPLVGNRRRHERRAYHGKLLAAFIHQGKRLPVENGQTFTIDGVDLSRGGIGLYTPWPLSIGDVLWIQFPASYGVLVKRYAKVVRIRRDRSGWVAGCRFIDIAKAQS